MSYFLSIKNDRIELSRNAGAVNFIIKSADDYHKVIAQDAERNGIKVEDVPVYASSSMDFPEEFTDDAAVIALAKELRK